MKYVDSIGEGEKLVGSQDSEKIRKTVIHTERETHGQCISSLAIAALKIQDASPAKDCAMFG